MGARMAPTKARNGPEFERDGVRVASFVSGLELRQDADALRTGAWISVPSLSGSNPKTHFVHTIVTISTAGADAREDCELPEKADPSHPAPGISCMSRALCADAKGKSPVLQEHRFALRILATRIG